MRNIPRYSKVACLVVTVACGARTGLDAGGGAPGEGGAGAGVSDGGSTSTCPVTSFAGDRTGGVRLVMDETHAYWTTSSNDIERGDLATGEVVTLASFGDQRPAAFGLANGMLLVATDTGLFTLSTEGGEVIALAPAAWRPVGLATVGDSVLIVDYGGGIIDGSVYEFSPAQGLRMLYQGLDFPTSIATDATHAYAAASGMRLGDEIILEGVIARIDRATGEAAIAIGNLEDPFDVDLAGDTIYAGEWLNDELTIDAKLLRAPKPAGVPELVGNISTRALPVAMALDDQVAFVSLPHFTATTPESNSQLVAVPLSGGDAEIVIDMTRGFFTEPAVNATHVAISVQPSVTGEPLEANVLVRCK